MNAYTIFIQNSSLVDKHEEQLNHSNKCNLIINWCGYLIITWIITSYLDSFYRHNQLLAKNDKVGIDEPDWNWKLTVVQRNVRPSLLIVVECNFE